jgi:hypothetical protein
VKQVASRAYYSTLKMEAACSSGTSVTFNGLHGDISQKIELFITTAVETSNPTTHVQICIKTENARKILLNIS